MNADLNDEDWALLKANLEFYQSLDTGARKPVTPAQIRFVDVLSGKLSPKTQHEYAYLKWKAANLSLVKPIPWPAWIERTRDSVPQGSLDLYRDDNWDPTAIH